ncbi:hypothetical protein [Vibrio metschnikovii]|uniref:hypothetical protein n=1 Tax=Vibrio metschnikovii TaxID=28172 RepID=UPI001C2FE197|nr:hypothetical protein [Vibrio metschnikovii]EKO3566966.1 hypothetical protein [Vibrio metschnikovii]EKO3771308.1 hypothetical protein [Vibrio metschnikovii]
METFRASVQYGDMKGSSAADKADLEHAATLLEKSGDISQNEFVVGISMWAGENHGIHTDPVSVKFLVTELNGYASIPEMLEANSDSFEVRVVRKDMNIADFLALFKRLEITLSTGGIIEGKSYTEKC